MQEVLFSRENGSSNSTDYKPQQYLYWKSILSRTCWYFIWWETRGISIIKICIYIYIYIYIYNNKKISVIGIFCPGSL